MTTAGGRRTRSLLVAVLVCALTLSPAAVLADSHGAPASSDLPTNLDEARSSLDRVVAEAERLTADMEEAQAALTSAEEELAATVAERQELEAQLERASSTFAARRISDQLGVLAEQQAEQTAKVEEAAGLVAMLEAIKAYNDLSVAELEYRVADLSARIAATRTVHRRAVAPPELLPYGNGRVPAEALVEIGVGGHRLWGPAADAFTSLRAAAAADGIRIGVTDSYRSFPAQVDLVLRKGLYAEGGLAARPGTSDHGWGLALDLVLDDEALAWMRTNAHLYGFVETTPREPWHWVFTARPGR